MTLKVTIKHDQPGYHKDAMVQCIHPTTKLPTCPDKRLTPGDSVSLYVYDGQQIVITEVPNIKSATS